MTVYEFFIGMASVSLMLTILFGLAAYFDSEELLSHAPFVTQSIGILWPLAGVLIVGATVFDHVARSQGVVFEEYEVFIVGVLKYTGLLTIVFAFPIAGILAGTVIRNKVKR